MSDHIPFEIQVEILRRLPVKSLIRFRSVSKPWKSLIDSSQFIADSSVHHSQPQRLLVRYLDVDDSEQKYILIDDDDTFPQRKCSLNVPLFIKSIENPHILGISQGLLCLYGYYREGNRRVVVLWNPSIRRSVVIKVPDEIHSPYRTVVGFGVCPNTNDPKIVKINCSSCIAKLEDTSCIPLQVEVFTLSSGAWRILSKNLPRKSINFKWHHMLIDDFIYWLAIDMNFLDDFEGYHLIISFDLKSEEFSEIYLPDYLSHKPLGNLWISKLRDSLVVLEEDEIGLQQVYGLWMMDHGVPNSFRKLFTIDTPMDRFFGFRENGEALQTIIWDTGSAALEVYKPSSKHIKDLGIYGQENFFFVSSFMETLFLLDQPDSSILF